MMKENCNCNKSFTTYSEYPCAKPACIRNKRPDCMATAVIPSITVDAIDGITNLANCFAHVTNINTTFYVDDKHRIMIVWAGPVEVQDYDVEENSLGLRSQFCFDTFGDGKMYYFDKRGEAHLISGEEV